MLQKKLILHFHHVYLLGALVALQRRCHILYSRLKHQVAMIIDKKQGYLTLKNFKALTRGKTGSRNCHTSMNNTEQYSDYDRKSAWNLDGARQICTDLNQMFMNANSVSVPMQMLFVPFAVVTPPDQQVGYVPKVDRSDRQYQSGQFSIPFRSEPNNLQHESRTSISNSSNTSSIYQSASLIGSSKYLAHLQQPATNLSWSRSNFHTTGSSSDQGCKTPRGLTFRNPFMY